MILDENVKGELKKYLDKLEADITINLNLDDSKKSVEMLEFINDVAGLTGKIKITKENDSATRKPSFSISKDSEIARVGFAGIPLGHEFNSFILALLHVSGYAPKLDEDKLKQVDDLKGELHFETYVSLECHNCPDVVQALNMMAARNENISHTMIDGAIFEQEVNKLNIMSVPTIHLNGEPFAQGRMSVEEILKKLDDSFDKKQIEKLEKADPFDILVVGGGPAGASAAIYAARKGIKTGIVGEQFGGQLLETMSIENFISVKSIEGTKFARALEEHVKEYGLEIINMQRAKRIEKVNDFLQVSFESGVSLKSRAIIVSTGARWRQLGVEGDNEYKGRGVAYCPHCEGPLFKGKRVAVIGGGNSGVEAAIDLAGLASHVTLLEFAPNLKADGVLQNHLRKLSNVDVVVNAKTTKVSGDSKVKGIFYEDMTTKEEKTLEVEGVFVQIGLIPNTDWLKDTLELNQFGEIIVDNKGKTSMEGIFAAGDCTNVPYKQIIVAMGEGAKASLGAFEYLLKS